MYMPKGIIPPVPTFINDDDSLDTEGMKAVIDHLIDHGVHGLFFLGTGGEFPHLSTDERKEVAEFAVRYVNQRVPVLIGTGTNSTRLTKELNAHAKSIDADAVVIINPYYFKFDRHHLYDHYDSLIQESELPVVLYNFPALTGQSIPVEIIQKLVDVHPNLTGIKNTVDNISSTKAILQATADYQDRFSVMAGFDDYILSGLQAGCQGAITGTGNIMPERSVALYNHYLNGEFKEAIHQQQIISKLCSIYELDTPFVGVIKAAVKAQGLPVSGATLPPLKPIPAETVTKMSKIIERCNRM